MKVTSKQMVLVVDKIKERLKADNKAWDSFDFLTKSRLIQEHALSVIAEAAFQSAVKDWDEGQSPFSTFEATFDGELENLVNIDKHA